MLTKIEKFIDSGVQKKPQECKKCPMYYKGRGFCNDLVLENPIIAFIFDSPTKDDVMEQFPLSGAQGAFWRKALIEDLGYKVSDVLVSHALRCKQENDKYGKPTYPTAWLGKQAELNCRRFDNSLIKFDPNLFVLSLHPRSIPTVGAHKILIQRAVEKAFSFARRGFRPCVLFGEGSASLYFPYLINNGGIKNWAGHWWMGSSPFRDSNLNEEKLNKKRFVEG